MSTTTVQQLPTGQLIANIPKALADALSIVKGTKIDWKIDGGRLYVKKQ